MFYLFLCHCGGGGVFCDGLFATEPSVPSLHIISYYVNKILIA